MSEPIDRTQEALDLLEQVAREHRIGFQALRAKGPFSRIPEYVKARADFCKRGRALGIVFKELAIALNRDHSTVVYHSNDVVQARKRKLNSGWTKEKNDRQREQRRRRRENAANSAKQPCGRSAFA